MMHKLILIFLTTLGLSTLSLDAASSNSDFKENPIIKCLAKEEEKFHQDKNTSANYRINQNFFNTFASAGSLRIKPQYVTSICNDKTLGPSVALIKNLILHEYELFESAKNGELPPEIKGVADLIIKELPSTFMEYLGGIQATMPTSDCLDSEIKELKDLKVKLKNLEVDLSTHALFGNKKDIEKIFNKLLNLDELKRICKKRASPHKGGSL